MVDTENNLAINKVLDDDEQMKALIRLIIKLNKMYSSRKFKVTKLMPIDRERVQIKCRKHHT